MTPTQHDMTPRDARGKFRSGQCADPNCGGQFKPDRDGFWRCNGLTWSTETGPLIACEQTIGPPWAQRVYNSLKIVRDEGEGTGMLEEFTTNEAIASRVNNNDGRIYIVSLVERVGILAFLAAIEWYWYPPLTPRNRFYDLYGARWRDMTWIIAAFPAGRFDAVKRLAKQLGLRIANGVPTVIGEFPVILQVSSRPSLRNDEFLKEFNQVEFFPGSKLANGEDNPNLFAVENDKNSPVYKINRHDEKTMMTKSSEVNSLLNRGIKLTPHQIADYIYGLNIGS